MLLNLPDLENYSPAPQHTHTKGKTLPPEKGSLSRKLVELLKVLTFVRILTAFTNEHCMICATAASSQQALCQQVEHPCGTAAVRGDMFPLHSPNTHTRGFSH